MEEKNLFQKNLYFDTLGYLEQNVAGEYLPSAGRIHVDTTEDKCAGLLTFAHEKTHFGVGNSNYGLIMMDFQKIIFHLYENYGLKLNMLMLDAFIKNNVFEENIIQEAYKYNTYVLKKSDEIESLIYQDKPLIDFLKFSYKIIMRYFELFKKSIIVQEGTATYVSLNLNERSDMNRFFVGLDFKKLTPEERVRFQMLQKNHKEYILSLERSNPYRVGYQLAEKLVNNLGENSLFLLAKIAMDVPFYHYDLIGSSENTFSKLLERIYNPDRRWSFFDKDLESIFSMFWEADHSDDFLKSMSLKTAGIETLPPHVKEYEESHQYTFHHCFEHPEILKHMEAMYGKNLEQMRWRFGKVIDKMNKLYDGKGKFLYAWALLETCGDGEEASLILRKLNRILRYDNPDVNSAVFNKVDALMNASGLHTEETLLQYFKDVTKSGEMKYILTIEENYIDLLKMKMFKARIEQILSGMNK